MGILKREITQILPFDPRKYGIPPKFENYSLDNFEGNEPLVERIRKFSNGGMVLNGKTGAGKTHLSVSIIRNLYYQKWIDHCNANIKRFEDGEPIEHRYSFTAAFITVPDFLLEIRDTFKSGCNETEGSTIEKYSRFSLLVLDDLGSEKPSEHTIMALYNLIDHRDRELKDTVITTNLTLPQIDERLNSRIASRLSAWDWIEIGMSDYRKRGK